MEEIACEPRPLCSICGSPGEVAQSGIRDPDCNINGSWSFQQCSNSSCRVHWLDPAPLSEQMWKAYATYHTHTQKSSGRFGKTMLSLAHRFIKLGLLPLWLSNGLKREADYLRFMTLANQPAGKLLDVGCGGGRFLSRMKKCGWRVEGTDFDEQAVNKVTARYGIKTHVGDLLQCKLVKNSYDAITMSQTIEHLYNPKETLDECLRLLKPGGLLVMTTPNTNSMGAATYGASWRGWEAPRHLHLFSVDSLQRLTKKSGFDLNEACTYSAGSAVVYRVSREIKEGVPPSWFGKLSAFITGYREELLEHDSQTKKPHTGQNILIRAHKPSL
jgi:2-polyprenyl-3-methyl-5-hydroxy-6-metoxy-1,4-benzoquinol methylase